jgi:hypothetical protein
MFRNFDDINQFGIDRFEAITTATASTAKGLQTIVAETVDYSKKSFEKNRVLAGKLANVMKADEAIQLQSDFAKSAYQDFIAQATKIGNLYSDLAKEAFRLTNGGSPAQSPVTAATQKAPIAAKQS